MIAASILIGSILLSCDPALYTPGQLNMPMADWEHEFRGEVYSGGLANGAFNGVGGEASYTLDTSLVIFGNGLFIRDTTGGLYTKFSADIGAGLYRHMSHDWYWEALAGMGYGQAQADIAYRPSLELFAENESIHGQLRGNYLKPFLQFDLYKIKDRFEFCFGNRFSYLGAMYIRDKKFTVTTNPFSNITTIDGITTINRLTNPVFYEPSVKFRLWVNSFLSLNTSTTLSLPITNTFTSEFNGIYWPIVETIGITVQFAPPKAAVKEPRQPIPPSHL